MGTVVNQISPPYGYITKDIPPYGYITKDIASCIKLWTKCN